MLNRLFYKAQFHILKGNTAESKIFDNLKHTHVMSSIKISISKRKQKHTKNINLVYDDVFAKLRLLEENK